MIPARSPSGRVPAPALPLAYLGAAVAALVIAAWGLPALARELSGHYYHPRILALTHTAALGWITLAIMGASYQLVPVALEQPIRSERLARIQLVVLVGGVVGMVAHFWLARWNGLAWAAGLVTLGIAGHGVNVGMSLARLPRWSFTARCVVLALGGLGLTAGLGLTLAANRLWPMLPVDVLAAVHAHFHVALLGWITPMILGVSARVYPMFLLAPEPGPWVGAIQLWGLAVGGPAVVLGILGVPGLVGLGALLAAAAGLAHAWWVAGAARRRRRPALDWGLRFALTGTVFVLPVIALGLGLAVGSVEGPGPAMAYAVLALGGWVSLTIVGMLLKIVPFLVWYRVYAPRVGKMGVPALADLAWPSLERAAYALLTVGMVGLAAALLAGSPVGIGLAGGLVALGTSLVAAALARALWHLSRPVATPPAPSGGVREGRVETAAAR